MPETPAQLADAWSLAAIWLDAEHVRDVFVLRAHLLDEQATLLLAACDTAHALPWLIIAGTEAPSALMELLDQVLLNPFHEPAMTILRFRGENARTPSGRDLRTTTMRWRMGRHWLRKAGR